MASFNRVVLLGNVTRDVEVRYTPAGMAVCDVGLAVNDKRKNAQGEWCDDVTFIDVTLWGRTAEVAGEYLAKGSPVLIEGRLKLDTWQTNDGQKRSKLKVVGERMQLLGTKKERPQQSEYSAPVDEGPAPWERDAVEDMAKQAADPPEDDAIPF